MERKYRFLRDKYYELLLPTLFMVMSEKIAVVIDVIIIGIIIGGSQLSPINSVSPLLYFTGILYILFGQGGSLLALRAKSDLDEEKSNFYFTVSIIGIIVVSLIYIAAIFFFADNILHLLNTPSNIFYQAKSYLYVIMFFYPLNCFIIVISYFIRSDGYPNLPFYSVLIANVTNIIVDFIFLKGFNMGIEGAALATVVGYAVGVAYISRYLLSKRRTFKFVSLTKLKIMEVLNSFKTIILNTPEVVGKIFFSTQMAVFTYLCSTYYGAAGLLAFLVYDNSETFVYIVLSGIMKAMSPIVAVFYKEMDFKAVQYIIKKSIKQILIVSVPVAVLFFVYPDILIKLFNITDPTYVAIVSFAIRVTSFGLIGRCMSYLLANYAQAIEQNRISFIITFCEEFLISIVAALILTHILGGIGIWIAILLSETIPVLIYIGMAIRLQRNHKSEINSILLLQDSNLVNFTYNREHNEYPEEVSQKVETIFKDSAPLFFSSVESICENIFEHDSSVELIDVTLRMVNGNAVVQFIDDSELYDPFSNKEFSESQTIKKLRQNKCEFEYTSVLGFNRSYVRFNY
ncbi:MAG: hypothetical protein E7Z78_07460 [Methanobrevibacter thaueri]|jgi:putative MATE family efflux protein|uniref:MATE family efflux transporter n=1 Tax=Methanobrevibacter thaueri TaxID=190975 RepID=UPI0026F30E28|nr:MATE family efflux transporter [Methanobrevibacter thaueri]MBE6496270.1 hypothetical protein [Methanobrevibacter thaueri]